VLVWSGKVHPVDATRYDATAIVANLLLVHAWLPSGTISFNYVSWSISAEGFVYLIFPLIALAVARHAALSLIGIVTLFAVFAWFAESQIGLPLTRLAWQAGVLRAVPGFAFGVWLHAHAPKLETLIGPQRAAVLFKILLLCVAGLTIIPISQYATLAVIWCMVAMAYLCDRARLPTWISVRPLASRGTLTYSLYMLHPPVATVLLAVVFPNLLGTSLPARIAGVLLSLPVLYALAVASLRWFETPARTAINRWVANRLPVAAAQ
jgi:peptidoglycan/LPS O-acetylase OafA/YrhL